MSRRRRRGGRGGGLAQAKINMDSLIDLTFLLLVTFMVTIPALQSGISIMLPRAKADTLPNKDNKASTITLDAQGKLWFGDVPTTIDELEAILKSKVAEDPDVPVLVRGDERLDYGSVMDVVKVVYKCKVRKMALVTVEEK